MSEQIPVKNVTPKAADNLYARREKIYTKAFTGIFRNLRIAFTGFLFLLFLGTAWINYEGRQAVWWNLPERKFYIFGSTFWPQDFVLLAWVLIICAFGLFFITVFAGRVWCGYACPQSIYTWIFMWCEKVTEGDRNQRMKLEKAPFSANKFFRISAKHILWLSIAFVTGFTFLGYFIPIRELTGDLISGTAGTAAYFWIAFFTVITYLNAGWMREQVCVYMCPYARFQSVMFDKDTLIVSYDEARGEGRGPRKRGSDYKAQGLGDCIDCKMCVHVCPTGIDIRDGLQIACIGCAACADACDSIMDKMGYERGLVGYTTEHNLAGNKTKLLRPRLIGYATALVVMMCLLAWRVYERPLIEVSILKDRTQYRESVVGNIENVYTVKVINKDQHPHTYIIEVAGFEGITLSSDSVTMVDGKHVVDVKEGEIKEIPVAVSVEPELITKGATEIEFIVTSKDQPEIQKISSSRFIGPVY